MRNEVTGVVSQALPIERGMGQRGPWATAKVVIEYDAGRYKNTLMLECRNNKAEDFAKLQRGQKVTCYYDVTSREYNGRWYHSVNCFDFAVEGAQPQAPAPAAAAPAGGAQNDGDPF
jgi:hypothetical protein